MESNFFYRAHFQRCRLSSRLAILALCLLMSQGGIAADDPGPPSKPVKLVFIHHSCGENWLADGNGNLGRELGKNNYFVSDSNYGWGPNSIGDRTDITDWPEWFNGPQSSVYTQALYQLNNINSPFARQGKDPGGENSVVMFKSCFPNSELEGRPNDSPMRSGGLTVGNAKAIYNDLLRYFATRPDKLFIAVTAPPVLDFRLGHNARAFNNWLVHEWLKGYSGRNVAVFDFYNVLTGPNNHHRFINGKVQHRIAGGSNTLYYSPGDDAHPTRAGNRKATAELIPLLNVYYHRWQAWLPSAPKPSIPEAVAIQPVQVEQPQESGEPQAVCSACALPIKAVPGGLIDNFDQMPRNWQVYRDEALPSTRLSCAVDSSVALQGGNALTIRYHIAPDSWASCSLELPAVKNWSGTKGVSFYLRMERPGQEVAVVAYGGDSMDYVTHFEHSIKSAAENIGQWQQIKLKWGQFVQPPWEGDGTATFNPAAAKGIAFIFGAPADRKNSGTLWVDEIRFLE